MRWLHLAVWLMAIGIFLVFFLGVDGLAIWTLAPIFLVASWLLSWGVYIKRWKGIAKPLLPPRLAQGPPPDPLSREARELEAEKIWEGEVQKEMERQGRMAPAPAAPLKSEAPQAFPELERTATKTLRCPKCKGTFEIKDPGTRPLPIKCTACGTEGLLKK